MILYRALQPLLHGAFTSLALVAKHIPFLKERARKFWRTSEIRYVNGRPAFYSIDPKVFGARQPIWIHAASGEFEYAKPVIRELAKFAEFPVFVTYFSPTYADNVRKFPGVDAACPLPLDSRDEIEQLIAFIKPRALMIARTDAWPNTVYTARVLNVPVLLFSATFHGDSKRLKGFGKSLTIETLKKIDQIQCVSFEDQSLLNSIGLQNAKVCGDTRYDQVLERLKNPKPVSPVFKTAAFDRSFIAGSIWPEDLLPVLSASDETFGHFAHTLFVVPHEISESFIGDIEQLAGKIGFKKSEIARFTHLNENEPAHKLRLVIVDSVGLLAELYQQGAVAFVGGSFRKTVHSVMEPLAAGCLTVVGPLHMNNREAIEFQTLSKPDVPTITFVSVAEDAVHFAQILKKLWKATDETDFKTSIRNEVVKRGGATAEVLRWLRERLG